MGTRGPQKTPTEILKMRGSWRGTSRDRTEPKPPKGTPTSQVTLTDAELVVFEQVVEQVQSLGLNAVTDGNALARYAAVVVRINHTKVFLEKHGETYPVYDRHADGTKTVRIVKRFPQSAVLTELEGVALRLEREFGLTPASRAGLSHENGTDTHGDVEARYFG